MSLSIVPNTDLAELSTVTAEIEELGLSCDSINGLCVALQRLLRDFINSDNMLLCTIENEIPRLLWVKDQVDSEIPEKLEHGITHYLARHGRSVLLQQTEISTMIARGQISLIGSLPKSWLGIMLYKEGQPFAAIVLQSYHGAPLTHRQRNFLDKLAPAISRALVQLNIRRQSIESAISEKVERRSQQLMEVMCQITELCQSEQSLSNLYPHFHQLLSQLMPAEHFAIASRQDADTIEFVFAHNMHLEDTSIRTNGSGLTEYLMAQDQTLLLSFDQVQELFNSGEVECRGNPAACWLGAPLIYAGKVIGALILQDYEHQHAYGEPEKQLIGYVAHHIANVFGTHQTQAQLANNQQILEQAVKQRTAELEHEISERRRIENQLRHDTLHDDLTGLPNRAMIMQRLHKVLALKARDSSFNYALMFLDLNRFKVINDSLGHLTGDRLLCQVSQRLNKCLRGFDTVARLGGDEFAVLVEHLNCQDDAIQTAKRIQETLSRPFHVGDEEIYSGASIGIAFGATEYQEPSELLRDADVAMYRAKKRKSKRPVTFDESMRQEALERMKLETELQRALDFGQFELHFQPIWDLTYKSLYCCEALVRWRHPERGLLLPGEFLPMMEENRQILDLDRRVISAACQQFAQLQQQHPKLADVNLSVNLSAEWFSRNDSLDTIMQALKSSGMKPQNLKIDVTERCLRQNPESAARLLHQLDQIGVQVMMDDFGTGYASLSYLHQLPLTVVKIDSSIINQMGVDQRSAAVVRTIFTLCRELEIDVCAEGVATIDHIKRLQELGCHYGQGFHLGKPMSVQQLEKFLAV